MRKKDAAQFALLLSIFCFHVWACKTDNEAARQNLDTADLVQVEVKDTQKFTNSYQAPEGWTILGPQNGIVVDIKYATDSNFTGKVIYDCAKCMLRDDVAAYLTMLQKHLSENYHLGLKVFDCYRPKPYQQRLWDIVPDARYVTPPAKGSMHSRGMAVDITLVDSLGNELDMGTAYDYFGKEAHINYTALPTQVLDNRKFLREYMMKYGFEPITSEWWHFSYSKSMYELEDFVWQCD